MAVRFPRILQALMLSFVLSLSSAAASVDGTVMNRTSRLPAAGADVNLINLDQGMREEARTTTDAQGRFHFDVSPSQPGHWQVRVTHGGVAYSQAVAAGRPIAIEIYDVSSKVAAVTQSVDDLLLQSNQNIMQVTEFFILKNESQPPRTLVSDAAFQFYVPPGAQLKFGAAEAPGQLPVKSFPTAKGKNGRYGFDFPLIPGITQFEVIYELPYPGQVSLNPRLTRPVNHVGVMLPRSMQFLAAAPGVYKQQSKEQGGMLVQLASQAKPGADLRFSVSGIGLIPLNHHGSEDHPGATPPPRGQLADERAQPSGPTPSTAGGVPNGGQVVSGSTAPEVATGKGQSLRRTVLYSLGWLGLGLGLVCAFILVAKRRRRSETATTGRPTDAVPTQVDQTVDLETESCKEKLFHLEIKWLQGDISREEYEAGKAALEPSLQKTRVMATSDRGE